MARMQNKTICIISASLIPGGAERFVSELANYFTESGIVTHLILMFKSDRFYELNPSIILHEPDFKMGGGGLVRKILYLVKLRSFLRTKIRDISPDTILDIGYVSLVIFCLLGLNIPLYVSNRSNPLKPRPWWYRQIRMLMYSQATGIIAQTQIAKLAYMKATRNMNITIVPNFVRKINHDPEILKQNNIISVGRLIRSKNFGGLIEIFSRLENKEWKLLIVGDGPLRNELEDIAEVNGVSDRVVFLGFKKDVDFFLNQSKIFAFTSLSEGYPNALLEAMATPLACISYDCHAGPSELIIDGVNGFLINIDDKEEYIRKLNQLVGSAQLRESLMSESVKVNESHSFMNNAKAIYDFITDSKMNN